MWNQAAGKQNVARRWNIVAGFVPEVGQAQQRRMQQKDKGKDDGERQSRMRRVRSYFPFSGFLREVSLQEDRIPESRRGSRVLKAHPSAPARSEPCAGRA